jgi:peptidoglycan/LPS O-acetylase OafA/YrhL
MNRYRPEIDGMRTLAVLAVVLFHARVPGFSAGFAGVDVFLVISGYLIAGLILRESDAGTFSLARFYERRVRRILPALLAMLAATALAGLTLLPGDLRQFGASLVAITAFLSNFLFARASGYFGLSADASPLLHTWSLAVEEQFYLFFPALLLLARRAGPRGLRVLLIAVTALSFSYSVWKTGTDPIAAFYSPASRAWEFLAGALLAAVVARPPPGRATGDAAALIGLGLIGASIMLLHAGTPFPGVRAIPVVAGSVMLLWGMMAEGSRMARALSLRPLVAIGLISYSLYLWHWPMIVFGSYYVLDPHVQAVTRLAMAALAFPVAWLSWRFIERPFRAPRLLLSRRSLFTGTIAASGALALYGGAVYVADGLPNRFDETARRLSERGPQPDYGCANRSIDDMRRNASCLIGGTGPRPSFLLWGDSHAAVYFPALDALARRHGVSGYDAAKLGCPALIPIRPENIRPEKRMLRAGKLDACDAHNAQVMQFIAETRPRVVLLAADWAAYSAGKRAVAGASDPYEVAFETGVAKLRALGIRVFVVQDVPGATFAEPGALAKAYLTGTTVALEPNLTAYLRRESGFRDVTADLQRRGLIDVIDPAARLCDRKSCRVTDCGYPLYYDSNHLSARGALFVAPVFAPMMRFLATSPPGR